VYLGEDVVRVNPPIAAAGTLSYGRNTTFQGAVTWLVHYPVDEVQPST